MAERRRGLVKVLGSQRVYTRMLHVACSNRSKNVIIILSFVFADTGSSESARRKSVRLDNDAEPPFRSRYDSANLLTWKVM